MIHVILCGGSGTRLWPLSNAKISKQFLKLFDDKSLMQLACENTDSQVTNRIVVTSQTQVQTVLEQLEEIGKNNVQIIEEPVGRNTAAAIALAAFSAHPEEVLLITPSDHLITTKKVFIRDIEKAQILAKQDYIVTIGLLPKYPETGFGYIQFQGNDVLQFIEKPAFKDAQRMVESGDFLWNSGMFCFKASTILDELGKYEPLVFETARNAFEEWQKLGHITKETMEKIPSISIDYAVMEKTDKIKVIPSGISWSDVGSFEALVEALSTFPGSKNTNALFIGCTENENTVIGDAKFTALLGVRDLIVVNTERSLLVLQKGFGQKVKDIQQWVAANRSDLL